MVAKYKHTYHRSIKLTPSDARNPANYQAIKDTLGEPVQGTFYEQELQLSVQEIFRIERRRKIRWEGYNDAFNSCVSLTDLEV